MFLKKIITQFFIILFLKILFIYKINCQETCVCPDNSCTEDNCNTQNNCKFFYEDNSCIECSQGEGFYYTKGSDNTCNFISIKIDNGKVIYKGEGTVNEVIVNQNCPGPYSKELGDFCFSNDEPNIVFDSESNQYKCINFYYKEIKNGFTYYNCLSSTDNCPTENYKYHIEGSFECIPECPIGNNYHIKESFECIPECPTGNYYHIKESFECIPECPTGNNYHIKGTNECIPECPTGNNYHIEGNNECISQCPSNYKYYVEENGINICYLNNCPKEYIIIESNIYKCSDTCEMKKYKIKDNNISFCLDDCPNEARFFYESIEGLSVSFEKNECLESCEEGHFSKENKCVPNCIGFITVDLNKNIFACDESIQKCPDLYPYLYSMTEGEGASLITHKYCLKSCKDTQNQYFNNGNGIETYLNDTVIFDNDSPIGTIKQCLSDNIEGFYKDEISLKWVNNCKTSPSGPYNDPISKFCNSSCEKYYIYNDLTCVNECNDPTYKYLDTETKACYDKCPSNLGRGFLNEEGTQCQSCLNPENEEQIGEKGFYKNGENICHPSLTSLTTYFHNNGENIIFEGGCNNKLNYDYKPFDSQVCYKSCSEIGDGSYKIEIEKTCYQEKPTGIDYTNYYYYTTSENIDKYIIIEKSFDECSKHGLYFVNEDSKCVIECNSNDYKILPKEEELGKCFSDINNLPTNYREYTFYNKTRILKKECDLLTIKDSDNGVKLYEGENCVNECPTGYYEYVSDKICKEDCDTNYYVMNESNKKKCLSEEECDKYKYVPNNDEEKKCVDKCTYQNNGKDYIYFGSNNNCLDTCIGNTGNEFSYEAKNDHLPCINSCPGNLYYYEDKHICINDCGEDYYKRINKQICVKYCENEEYIHPGNICSNEACPSNAPFYYEKEIEVEGTSSTIINKKCVPNCKENEFYKIGQNCESGTCIEDFSDKKCVDHCDILSYNGRCYDECPEGLYKSGNECVPKCNPNIFKEESGQLICIDNCPDGDLLYLTS